MLLTTSIFLMALGRVVLVNVEGAWLCPQALAVRALNVHNRLRAQHGVPFLTLDNDLVQAAEKCAAYYAQMGYIDHSCPYKNEAGENLSGGANTWSEARFASDSPIAWYDEIRQYDYNNPGYSTATGHFTQVVWKSSEKFGFGVTTINGYTAGVALYSPPVYLGEFPENVLPRIS